VGLFFEASIGKRPQQSHLEDELIDAHSSSFNQGQGAGLTYLKDLGPDQDPRS
jgi:hypothetical protein